MATVGLRVCFVFLMFLAVSAEKVSQGTQTELPRNFFDYSNLSIQDLLRCGAMVVGMLVIAMSDKRGEIRNWQTMDAFLSIAEGFAAYFFPQQILEYIVRASLC